MSPTLLPKPRTLMSRTSPPRRWLFAAVVAGLLAAATPASASDPVASFTALPEAPAAGEFVEFESTATAAPDHTEVLALAWDLDGDGEFDDASGSRARRSYPAGAHVVRLRARYAPGHESVAERTLQVAAVAGHAATPTPTPTPTPTASPAPQPPRARTPTNRPSPPSTSAARRPAAFVLCAGLSAREQKPHTIRRGAVARPRRHRSSATSGTSTAPAASRPTAAPTAHAHVRALQGPVRPGQAHRARARHRRRRRHRRGGADADAARAERASRRSSLGRLRATGQCLRCAHGRR